MRSSLIITIAAVSLSGCVQTLEDYRPVVDPGAKSSNQYERDLAACYNVAKQAEAAYQKRQEEEMGANLIAGVLAGALIGAALGNSDTAGASAIYGGAAGVASTDTELATGGPRRIIDRCMGDRGHKILSDLGRG
tara:strand:+ start:254 stop:658 length:405 start_codon:yes stop_codon:yes gene_type:complete